MPQNQKQLGFALFQYAQDNDGLMPNISDTPGSTNTWRAMIYPNTKNKSIYRCPDDKAPDGPDGFPPSYAANYSGSYNNGSTRQRLWRICRAWLAPALPR